MNEQIEEMEQIIKKCDDEAMYASIAYELYNADYHKQEWISVEDRLPEKEGVYLVHTTYNIIETEVFYISKHDDISYWWDLDGMVTHWMPLPEPPKMKGGAE